VRDSRIQAARDSSNKIKGLCGRDRETKGAEFVLHPPLARESEVGSSGSPNQLAGGSFGFRPIADESFIEKTCWAEPSHQSGRVEFTSARV
jgi:hypothetical protein